jgi:protein-S-isoprenylcysteine O-methyltransferase Ste14
VNLRDWTDFYKWSVDRWIGIIGVVLAVAALAFAVWTEAENKKVAIIDYSVHHKNVFS